MGHRLSDWQVKVRSIVKAANRRDVPTDRIETVGLRPAFMRYSSDRPRHLVAEAAGAAGSYFDLPTDWAAGVSRMTSVEMPARQNPPRYLADEAWLFVRSPTDVDVEQIVTAATAGVGTHVRFFYTAPWPFPTNEVDGDGIAVVDRVDDQAFEAVASLAASYVIIGLELDSRRRSAENAAPADAKAAGIPDESLLKTAAAYEAIYLRFLGIDPTTPGSSTSPAASMPLNFDPQRDSMFHGGRW